MQRFSTAFWLKDGIPAGVCCQRLHTSHQNAHRLMIEFATMALTTTCDKFTERTGAGTCEKLHLFWLSRVCSSSSSSRSRSRGLVKQISNLHESFSNVIVAAAQTFWRAHSIPIIGVDENNGATASCWRKGEAIVRGGRKAGAHEDAHL